MFGKKGNHNQKQEQNGMMYIRKPSKYMLNGWKTTKITERQTELFKVPLLE